MDLIPLDWDLLLQYALQVGVAYLLALPIALERERATRIMGLRTFPLVAVASCGYVLIAVAVLGPGEDAQSRIIQGLMTGIGFLGGGAILKEGVNVRGTATAASVWMMGAVGGAVGYQRYEIAIILSLLTLLTLVILTPVERRIHSGARDDESGDGQAGGRVDDKGDKDG